GVRPRRLPVSRARQGRGGRCPQGRIGVLMANQHEPGPSGPGAPSGPAGPSGPATTEAPETAHAGGEGHAEERPAGTGGGGGGGGGRGGGGGGGGGAGGGGGGRGGGGGGRSDAIRRNASVRATGSSRM